VGYPVEVCDTAEEAVRKGDVIFTQTPGSKPVLELSWLKPHATIIASGELFTSVVAVAVVVVVGGGGGGGVNHRH